MLQVRIGEGDLPWAAARSSLRKSHRHFLRALRTPTALGKTEEPSLCLRRTVPLSDKALKGNGDMRDLRKTFRHLPMIPAGCRRKSPMTTEKGEERND